MQRKNRLLKVKVNVPAEYESDEDFLADIQETMDAHGWNMVVMDEDVPITSIVFNEFEVTPEEEE